MGSFAFYDAGNNADMEPLFITGGFKEISAFFGTYFFTV